MDCIFKAREHLERIWSLTELCSAPPSTRTKLVSSMLFVSLNHCDAIQLLAHKRNFASANALLRPLFETTFRAMWLHRCATDTQVEKCIINDKWKSPWVLIQEVESRLSMTPLLSRMWEDMRPFMHSFTHGGIQNAARQVSPNNTITPNLRDEEVRQLMQKVGVFSWVILKEIIDLTDSENLVRDFEQIGMSLNEWAFAIPREGIG
jgi:hypothetical protein